MKKVKKWIQIVCFLLLLPKMNRDMLDQRVIQHILGNNNQNGDNNEINLYGHDVLRDN